MDKFFEVKDETECVLIVARHCETDLNAIGAYQGQSFNYFLTQAGEQQAKDLRDNLNQVLPIENITRLVASTTRRAHQTVKMVRPDLKVSQSDKMLPYGLGEADGQRKEDLSTINHFPNPLKYGGMENFLKYLRRAKQSLCETILLGCGETTLACTHKDITGLWDKWLMKRSFVAVPKLGIPNGGFRVYRISNIDRDKLAKNDLSGCKVELYEECENYFGAEID